MATLCLHADLTDMTTIRDFVADCGCDLGLDLETIEAFQLAVDEACTNAVEHGYDGHAGAIEVTMEAENDQVCATVRNWGAPFDPDLVPIPDVNAPLEKRALGGLGVFLIRQLMDHVEFKFDPVKGNTLTMIKHRNRRES
ncbi:MAG: ATP-binding protein [Anaerolineae bacterium]|nr:ATP-binding protein [Anaerolineae bacterium]